jgi:methylmalonyl-CoA mutase
MSTIAYLAPSLEKPVQDAFAQWRQAVEAELKGVPFDKKLVTRTFEGIALQPLYGPGASAGVCAPPGVAPYTRGSLESGYASRPWTVCQETDATTPEVFNAAARRALARGQSVLALRLDRAGRIGLDPEEITGTDTADGVTIADGEDLKIAFDKIALADVSVQLDAGVSALPLAALFLTHAREKRATRTKFSGGLTADPLGEWSLRGTLPVTLEALYEDLAGWTLWAQENAPSLATIGVSGVHWHEAGGNAVQELALTIATGAEYLRELSKRGVAPDVASARMRFRFSTGAQFFTELAKFRAFRSLWSRVLIGFDVEPAKGWPVVHAESARWNQTKLDPHVNMLRATTGALSAVLGGVDSLHVRAFNDVLGCSDEISQRIASNVHTLLAEEFRLLSPADPAGGSWYVESLTDELARKAWKVFQEIEGSGGFVKAFANGLPQKIIAATAAEKLDAINKRRAGLVGTNVFPNLKERLVEPVSDDARAVRIAEVVARRPRAKKTALPARWPARLREAMVAASAGATIGQLMTRAYGIAPASAPTASPVRPWRASQGFESLRIATDVFTVRTGKRPQVFLAKMGPALQHKARADFSSGFFAAGGFEPVGKLSFETPESAALAAVNSSAPVVVLCSTDETYPTIAPVFARAVKAAAPEVIVVLAGYPTEHVPALREAGIDEFIHVRADVHDVLAKLLIKIGATLPTHESGT